MKGEGAEALDIGMFMGELTRCMDCEATMEGEAIPENDDEEVDEEEEEPGSDPVRRLDAGGDDVVPGDAVVDEEAVDDDEDPEEDDDDRWPPRFRGCDVVVGGCVACMASDGDGAGSWDSEGLLMLFSKDAACCPAPDFFAVECGLEEERCAVLAFRLDAKDEDGEVLDTEVGGEVP